MKVASIETTSETTATLNASARRRRVIEGNGQADIGLGSGNGVGSGWNCIGSDGSERGLINWMGSDSRVIFGILLQFMSESLYDDAQILGINDLALVRFAHQARQSL